jgi:hypothetical protein
MTALTALETSAGFSDDAIQTLSDADEQQADHAA